ncbi:hypothetical protein TNCV_1443551 [Trichonephila clavipes]|nr:hypothetical protein TNCV_1443551 [Trichonephila clavipes]
MNLLNLSVEDRQTKAEHQLEVINSQLELEKIKLQQIEREIELQKTLATGQATQQSSKGDTNNLENLIKSVKTMKSENKDKDTGYTVNQIETCIPNQNNFLFNELQCVDVIVDDTPLSATLDSGANSVSINTKLVNKKMQEENGRTYHRKRKKSSISEMRIGSNRENSVWKQDEAMDFALMREEV